MKLKLLTIRDAASKLYQDTVVALKQTSWRRPVTTQQEPSTQRLLTMTPEQLAEYRARELPTNWAGEANGTRVEEGDAGAIDVMVGRRAITSYEKYTYKWLQHRTEGRNMVGQSDVGSVDAEKRAKGILAFLSASGTGRKYHELDAAEKARVQNYFLEFMTRALTPKEYAAVKTEDSAKIDKMIATAIGEKHD